MTSDSEVAIILLRKDWDIAVGGKLIWAFEAVVVFSMLRR